MLLLCLCCPPARAAGPHRPFDVPAGDATQTLNEFGRQAGLQVLFDFKVVNGLHTRAVHGDLDAGEALRAMLKGTKLTFEFVNDQTLTVTRAATDTTGRRRSWGTVLTAPHQAAPPDDLEQILISTKVESGTQPLLGAETLELTREDIDRSGLPTVQTLLRSLPQVFGGGPSEDTLLNGREANTNSARGAGVNLRGLDAGATLVLLDGRRLAPSGTQGAFEDISNIPLSIIDHVDVLPDGAAARYGADAMGGVINLITRSNFTGGLTQARMGGVTEGHMGQQQLSQLLGTRWDAGGGLVAFEYFHQDPLQARDRAQETSDLRLFGGSDFNTPFGSPGTLTDGLHYWPLPKGQNGKSLTAVALTQGVPNLYDEDRGTQITPGERRLSLFARGNDRLGDDTNVFAEGLLARRTISQQTTAANPLILSVPVTNPFYVNPAGLPGPVTVLSASTAYVGPPVSDNRIDTGNFALGMTRSMRGGWIATGFLGYTFEKQHELQHGIVDPNALAAALADPNPATALDPFGDGANTNPATLAAIGGTAAYDLSSELKSFGVTATGPLAGLPAGDILMTTGGEYRDQTLTTGNASPTQPLETSGLGRRTGAAFAEVRLPLIGSANALPLIRRLELSLGARYEHYSDVGGATVPKFGALYSPLESVSLRTTWARSFRPPNLPDTPQRNSFSELLTLPDATAASGLTTVLARFGTNPQLVPERAHTWTLGADWTPGPVPGLSLSLTYFDVLYRGRVEQAEISEDVLQQPQFAWLVQRNFTAAERSAACSQSNFLGVAADCLNAPIGAILDNRLQNIALLETRGMDLMSKYTLTGSLGRLELGFNGTYLFNYTQANTPDAPLRNIVSTQNNPIDLRLRGSAVWIRAGFGISAFLNYDNAYRDTLSVPERRIASWTTLDLQVSYETSADSPVGRLQLALSTQNVFNTLPPFENNPVGVGYDQENADLFGRIVTLDVRKRW